ncbi:MAG: ABC transporter ATP-binding protein [Planctomycetes bacterium]|nr:ABC transporter ATP-binding protein [Planctomycetota bacterium]MBM4079935.1 ABC transporter ATP-binding protein [Planctomycetota bacterium]
MEANKFQMPVIEVAGLVKSFEGRNVLDGINMTVNKGETMVIMGGSGCGKSTVLRCLIGAYRPEAGSICVFGKEITTMSEAELNEVRKKFGILFQSGALYNSMTVGENVALPMREHTELDDNIISIMVKMKLELVGLRDFDHLKPAQLSGGMQKRVGLARAIALDPEILFYDEPTTGLDPITAGVINQLIVDLSDKLGVTSLVVTHDMNSAFMVADKMMMLYEGKVVQQGTPDEIRNTSNPLVKQFISGAPDGPIPLRRSSKEYALDLVGS